MCVYCYQEARQTGLSPSKLAVLKELAFHANEDARAWPSIATIVRFTGWSRSTVNRCLKFLRDNRLIHRDPNYKKWIRSSCYMIDRHSIRELIERRELDRA